MTQEVIKQNIKYVRISIMSGPLGKCIALSNPSKEAGGGTVIAGNVDGFGVSEVIGWNVNVDRIIENIDVYSHETEEVSYIDY